MSFLYPEYLFFIVVFILYFYKMAKGFKNKIHTIILVLLFIALSRPVYEKIEQESVIDAKDILIALDVSNSMMANDFSPNRYEYAKRCIEEFLELNQNDNVMLVVFTTNPLLLSPPTTDHNLILTSLEALNPEYILTKGTSLSNLFKKVKELDAKDKNLILITDGGDEDDIKKLSDEIREQTKSLTILAMGDERGSTIQKQDGSLLKDADSNLVISRLNPILEKLADKLDANFLQPSISPKQTALLVNQAIKDSNKKTSKKEYKFEEYYQLPLFIAAILFLMLHTKWVKYLMILFPFVLDASIIDRYYLDSAYQNYNKQDYNSAIDSLKMVESKTLQSEIIKANTLYKMGEYEQALKIYITIKTTDAYTKKSLNYNIANCFAKLGNYRDAKIFYAKTLSFEEDKEASENLEMIIFKENKNQKEDGKEMPTSQQSSQKEDELEAKDKNSQEKQNSDAKVKDTKERFTIGSKTYELINEGYINETKPW